MKRVVIAMYIQAEAYRWVRIVRLNILFSYYIYSLPQLLQRLQHHNQSHVQAEVVQMVMIVTHTPAR